MKIHVVVLPGDGTGPEVMAQGLRVLRTVGSLTNTEFEVEEIPCGGQYYLQHRRDWPEGAEERCAGNCHEADERCEECVLDKILPLFVTDEAKCEGLQSGHCVISQIIGTSSDLAAPATTPDRATEPLVSINRQLTIPRP